MNEEEREYFERLCRLACGRRWPRWSRLLTYLYEREFTYTLDMDENRAVDGCALRTEYGFASDRPCSVLEMMAALARRCEVHIMGDPEYGDRTSQWFWEMIESLGLADMDDVGFDKFIARQVVDRLLTHRYRANGRGGLFTIPNCPYDLRKVDIWYQMMWHLNRVKA